MSGRAEGGRAGGSGAGRRGAAAPALATGAVVLAPKPPFTRHSCTRSSPPKLGLTSLPGGGGGGESGERLERQPPRRGAPARGPGPRPRRAGAAGARAGGSRAERWGWRGVGGGAAIAAGALALRTERGKRGATHNSTVSPYVTSAPPSAATVLATCLVLPCARGGGAWATAGAGPFPGHRLSLPPGPASTPGCGTRLLKLATLSQLNCGGA